MNNNYEAEIKACLEKYETILREQIARAERMEQDAGAVDYSKKDKIIIGLIGGDGIGPIIMESAKKVLELLLKDKIAEGKAELRVIEGLTLENRLAKGQSVPDDVLAAIKACDVILKGPTTTPKGGTDAPDMESANVTLRRELDLYANVRPVSVPEKGIDWTFFRENTEGEYVLGSRGVEIKDKLACDFKVTTDAGTKRIARAAFEFAKNNGKDNVAIVTKANIMKKTDGKFSRIANQIAAEYPEISSEEWYIDIMAANLVNENIRTKFKVFLLPNLYGDIITDEAAQIQGGVGTGGSSNVGDRYAMFEAIHGSAPRMIAEGIGHYANPQSVIKAAEMLLRHVCLIREADILAAALEKTTASDAKIKIDECKGATCAEYTDYLLEELANLI
ncbi:MAG: isocitrate/isopropylmalate dehydrogenase family protein [Ruminococcaceae bacterium]|nr:isocitrate/isopropylmalate dehydrogenase family protein [Oscillospiraceae bacterium]